MSEFVYRLFGFWIRREAVRLAALTFRNVDTEEGHTPRLWSLAVFFEKYMCDGATETLEDFGPKEPTELKAVSRDDAA